MWRSSNRFGEGQIKVTNLGRSEKFFSPKRSDLGWPILRPIPWVPPDVLRGRKRLGCEATTLLRQVPGLSMSGCVSPLLSCVFIAYTGTALLFLQHL